jgi:hypothetical protein
MLPVSILSQPTALVRPGLVLADRHRGAAQFGLDQRLAHQSGHRINGGIDFGLTLFQQVEKLFCFSFTKNALAEAVRRRNFWPGNFGLMSRRS